MVHRVIVDKPWEPAAPVIILMISTHDFRLGFIVLVLAVKVVLEGRQDGRRCEGRLPYPIHCLSTCVFSDDDDGASCWKIRNALRKSAHPLIQGLE